MTSDSELEDDDDDNGGDEVVEDVGIVGQVCQGSTEVVEPEVVGLEIGFIVKSA